MQVSTSVLVSDKPLVYPLHIYTASYSARLQTTFTHANRTFTLLNSHGYCRSPLCSSRGDFNTTVTADAPRMPTTQHQSSAQQRDFSPTNELSYLIVSGGTGANSIISAFGASPAFVLPVSDDGGSSSEILRCFGGPSIGDIRELYISAILTWKG